MEYFNFLDLGVSY